jgi:hypothetical protein
VLKRALLSVNVGDDVFVCRVFDWFLRGLALDMLHRIGFLEFFYVISLCEMTSKKNCGVQVVFSCKNLVLVGLCYPVKMVYCFVMWLIDCFSMKFDEIVLYRNAQVMR